MPEASRSNVLQGRNFVMKKPGILSFFRFLLDLHGKMGAETIILPTDFIY